MKNIKYSIVFIFVIMGFNFKLDAMNNSYKKLSKRLTKKLNKFDKLRNNKSIGEVIFSTFLKTYGEKIFSDLSNVDARSIVIPQVFKNRLEDKIKFCKTNKSFERIRSEVQEEIVFFTELLESKLLLPQMLQGLIAFTLVHNNLDKKLEKIINNLVNIKEIKSKNNFISNNRDVIVSFCNILIIIIEDSDLRGFFTLKLRMQGRMEKDEALEGLLSFFQYLSLLNGSKLEM